MTPDLLAESSARALAAAATHCPRGTLSARQLPPPYGPDPIVFGAVLAAGDRDPYGRGDLYQCPVHHVTWRGGPGCWIADDCKGEAVE